MIRYKRKKSLNTFIIMLILGLCLICIGIFALNKKYDAPVYISRKFSISGMVNYTISGEISNMTSSDIYISSLTVTCSADEQNNTRYTAYWTKKDIIVPANSTITIYEDNLTILYNGSSSYATYNSISKVSCEIDNIDYSIKYSKDGKHFANDKDTEAVIAFFVIGGILCFISLAVFALEIIAKKKSLA